MAKGTKGGRGRSASKFRSTPYPLPSMNNHQSEDLNQIKRSKHHQKNDWEDATCSVCMEFPHNAVLLLCSSYDKGCRPYMCGTSFRYSNCLDQYQKAQNNVTPTHQIQPLPSLSIQKCETANLACPLCRGQVKGWTVVEHAREFLNAKKRGCMHDNCPFVGNFKATRKHVRAMHPSSRPREVDPVLEHKWRLLEREREMGDVISTITSSMPGAVFQGDYVIEGSQYDSYSGYEFDRDDDEVVVGEENDDFVVEVDGNLMNVLLLLQAFGSAGDTGPNRDASQYNRTSNSVSNNSNGDEHSNETSLLASRFRPQGGFVLRGIGTLTRSRRGQ